MTTEFSFFPAGDSFHVHPHPDDGLHFLVRAISLTDGSVVIFYTREIQNNPGADSRERSFDYTLEKQRYSPEGEALGTPVIIDETRNARSGAYPVYTQPSATPLANGGYAIAWFDGIKFFDSVSSIRVKTYTEDGSLSVDIEPPPVIPTRKYTRRDGTESTVQPRPSPSDGNREHPAMAIVGLADGGFSLTFGSTYWGGRFGDPQMSTIYTQTFDANAQPISDPIKIMPSYASGIDYTHIPNRIGGVASLNDGGYVVVFYANRRHPDNPGNNASVIARIFGDDGQPVSENFLVNQDPDVEIYRSSPSVATLKDGSLIFAWSNYVRDGHLWRPTRVAWRHFSADGVPLNSEQLLVDENNWSFVKTRVHPLNDGGFALSFTRSRSGTNGQTIYGTNYAALFDTNGTQLGDIFEIGIPSDIGYNRTNDVAELIELQDGSIFSVWETLPSGINTSRNVVVTPLQRTPTGPNYDSLISPMYRFQNISQPGTYLFAGEEEAISIRANFPNFVEEGFAFNVANEKTDPLLEPFYRFQNTTSGREGTYLFAGEEEAISIRTNFPNFVEEGLAFYAFPGGVGAVEFSRFQNTSMEGTYLFAGPSETTSILENFPTFAYEGIAFGAGV